MLKLLSIYSQKLYY